MPIAKVTAEYAFSENEMKEHMAEILDMSQGVSVPVEEMRIKARVNIPEDYVPGRHYNLHVSELVVLWVTHPEEKEDSA